MYLIESNSCAVVDPSEEYTSAFIAPHFGDYSTILADIQFAALQNSEYLSLIEMNFWVPFGPPLYINYQLLCLNAHCKANYSSPVPHSQTHLSPANTYVHTYIHT